MIVPQDLWAVVPVAGFGSRLRPHTYTRPKPLLPVAGQPIIGHILDQLVPLGVRRIVLVIGYMGERIVDYIQSRRNFDRVEWVEQKALLGLGHAIVRNAIVGEQAVVENALVEDSLIGFQSRLKGRWSQFNIGDLSDIS